MRSARRCHRPRSLPQAVDEWGRLPRPARSGGVKSAFAPARRGLFVRSRRLGGVFRAFAPTRRVSCGGSEQAAGRGAGPGAVPRARARTWQACTSSGNSWCRATRSSQPSASGLTSSYASSTRGSCGQPNSASIARSLSRCPPYAAGSISQTRRVQAPHQVARPEVAVQPGGRLVGAGEVGDPPDHPLDGGRVAGGDPAAVAGELEVGQHPAGREELRPGGCLPVRQRQGADVAVHAGGRPEPGCARPVGRGQVRARSAPRPRRSAGRPRPRPPPGSRPRRRAPRGRRPRGPRPASAGRRPRSGRSRPASAAGSSSAPRRRWRAAAGWRCRCRRPRPGWWRRPRCRGEPRPAPRRFRAAPPQPPAPGRSPRTWSRRAATSASAVRSTIASTRSKPSPSPK